MTRSALPCVLLVVGQGLVACTPSFDDTTAVVTSPRLLAVQASPAEGPTGTAFRMSALYVGPGGPADAGAITWDTCLLQKPLGDPGSVNPACLSGGGGGLVSLGHGGTVGATLPANACELFGPESPPPAQGQPSARPTDPDSTGGYYLPVRVAPPAGGDSVAFERIACQPSGVIESVFNAFSTEYVANENPEISGLARVHEGGADVPVEPDGSDAGAPATVSPGSAVALRVTWPTCPSTAMACGGAESYVLIDPSSSALTTSRESMVASWYASDGTFALDRVGRGSTDTATNVVNTWTAPTTTGPVHLWVVLRDARGGVGWQSYTLTVGG